MREPLAVAVAQPPCVPYDVAANAATHAAAVRAAGDGWRLGLAICKDTGAVVRAGLS